MVNEKFRLGCCYYPEHWDESALQSDIERIRSLGFNTIRMGEFSWGMYEPEEGKYDFSLLTKAVQAAEACGIDVILGTPTAAPPKWLIDRYPEVLCRDANGVLMQHGSRQHHNHTSEIYLKYCAAITEAMVKHFCGFKNVVGWQLDNELNCHRSETHADTDDAAFRLWVEKKYGTIGALNDAWGTNFWSLNFSDFSQVEIPKPTPTHRNPSWVTDYYLFISDTVIDFAALQTQIIRKHMPQAFITHNGWFDNIDYKKFTEQNLDVLGFDSYPEFQEQNGIAQGRNVEFQLARTRGCSDKFLILEHQSGPGGQLSYLLPTPLPGQIRLWTYQSIAHGAVGVLYFRYRTAVYGAEQLWYGIYDHDGEENYRSREIRQISEEIGRVGGLFLKERIAPQVAIYSDYHNACCEKAEPFFKNDSWEIFTALNERNIHPDILFTPDGLEKYKVVIFPHTAIANEALREKIERFTRGGGIAILSARSGVKFDNAQYRPVKSPGVFRPLTGCRSDWFTSVPKHMRQAVQMNGKVYPVDTYFEMLETEGGEAVGTYTEGFCKGKAAVVKNGNVYYLGFYCHNAAEIYYDIIREYIPAEEPLHKHLEEVVLGGYTMYLNHGEETVALQGHDLLQEQDFDSVPPYGVALVKNT